MDYSQFIRNAYSQRLQRPQVYQRTLTCRSLAFIDREDLEDADKGRGKEVFI